MLKNLQNKTVLVTGRVGFIGYRLCETLLSNNIKTVCLDNFFSDKRENIQTFLGNNNFKLIDSDFPHSLASVDKAKKLLNFNPKHNINDGIKEAVSWYWKHL